MRRCLTENLTTRALGLQVFKPIQETPFEMLRPATNSRLEFLITDITDPTLWNPSACGQLDLVFEMHWLLL